MLQYLHSQFSIRCSVIDIHHDALLAARFLIRTGSSIKYPSDQICGRCIRIDAPEVRHLRQSRDDLIVFYDDHIPDVKEITPGELGYSIVLRTYKRI